VRKNNKEKDVTKRKNAKRINEEKAFTTGTDSFEGGVDPGTTIYTPMILEQIGLEQSIMNQNRIN